MSYFVLGNPIFGPCQHMMKIIIWNWNITRRHENKIRRHVNTRSKIRFIIISKGIRDDIGTTLSEDGMAEETCIST